MVMRLVGEVLEEVKTPLYRNAIFLMVNTLSVAGLGFVFWVVAAHLYEQSPDVVNADLILIQAATYLGILSSLGFGQGLVRFLPTTDEDPQEMVNSSLTLGLLVSLPLSALFVLGVHRGLWYTEGISVLGTPLDVLGFFVFTLLFVPLPLLDYLFIARRSANLAALKNFVLQAAKLALLLFFFYTGTAHAIILGYALGVAISLGLALFYLIPRVVPRYRPTPALRVPLLRSLFHFSFLNHIIELLGMAPGVVLLFMVDKANAQKEIPAAFGITWLIVGTAILVVPAAAATSLFAEGSHDEDLARDVRRTVKFTLALVGPVIAIVLLFGEFILGIFGPTYAQYGSDLLRVLALSGLFYSINSIYIAIKRVEKRMALILAMMIFTTGLTIGLSYYLLTRQYSIVATGYAWLLGQAILSAGIGLNLLVTRLFRRPSEVAVRPRARLVVDDGRRP